MPVISIYSYLNTQIETQKRDFLKNHLLIRNLGYSVLI